MSLFGRLICQSATEEPHDSTGWSLKNQTLEIDLTRVKELKQAGGAVRLEKEDLETRILVVHGIDGEFYAYKNNCACGGFRIDPVPGEEKIKCCTLGQSTYDYKGTRISGPAENNLTLFPAEKTGEKLIIRLES